MSTQSTDVSELTGATFDEEIHQSPVPGLVEFGAEWCPPCRLLTAVLDSIAAAYAGRLRVFTVDSDHEPALARRYEVLSVPTLLVFSDGVLNNRMVGARSQAGLMQELAGILS